MMFRTVKDWEKRFFEVDENVPKLSLIIFKTILKFLIK